MLFVCSDFELELATLQTLNTNANITVTEQFAQFEQLQSLQFVLNNEANRPITKANPAMHASVRLPTVSGLAHFPLSIFGISHPTTGMVHLTI